MIISGVESAEDISELEVVSSAFGIELRMWIAEARMQPYSARRRLLAGPTGCGLCGIESLSEASRPARRVGTGLRVAPETISTAMAELSPASVSKRRRLSWMASSTLRARPKAFVPLMLVQVRLSGLLLQAARSAIYAALRSPRAKCLQR